MAKVRLPPTSTPTQKGMTKNGVPTVVVASGVLLQVRRWVGMGLRGGVTVS